MTKLGRNDMCHCGSGKKYKKCCTEKDQTQAVETTKIKEAIFSSPETDNSMMQLLSYDEMDELSTEEVIEELIRLGIPFEKDIFLEGTRHFTSAQALSESWFSKYQVSAQGRMEDFPFLAAWVLWDRLASPENLPEERLEDLINEGLDLIDEGDPVSGCDLWLTAWDGIKKRHKKEFKDLEKLEEQYRTLILSNLCQDLELYLHNAGMKNPAYFEKRIDYCREFCELLPEESELILHNMRRAIADSYSRLGQYNQAESEFQQLVHDYPANPWGYIGWGDMYYLGKKQDFERAKSLYEKALNISDDKSDQEAVKERIQGLEREI